MSPRRVRRLPTLVVAAAAALVVAVALPATAVPPTQVFAELTSATAGSLDGTGLAVSGCTSATLGTSDLSGADFSPTGSATQATITCTTDSAVTIALDAPLTAVDLYLSALPYGPCVDGSYTVGSDGAGTAAIASGFIDSTLVGGTLTVPFDSANSGVIHVVGPVSQVVLTSLVGTVTATFTVATVHVEPTTTTTSTTTSTTLDPAAVAGAGVGASAVTPAFTC